MGVIKQFAISSMVLGVLAMAGGASALAFDGGGGEFPAVQPADEPALPSDVRSDVPSDVRSDMPEVLPDTGGPSAAWDWFAPHGR
ncbi:hypothetical protein [Sporichthya sp.]|uniref:hypothetical protein n=1 Tax=Sporichthya sp. TaxID=65475 RepID=UPI0017C7896E|nr:hypothetical protein [Sporichthya sp.]MBA3744898.1 hypothetical protein [Sporichthya sp.]